MMRRRLTNRRSEAFTIVEVLVSMAIMTVALLAIYQIWNYLTGGSTTEIWATEINAKLTQADTRVREYVARAGRPAYSTPQGYLEPTNDTSKEPYLVKFPSAGGTDDAGPPPGRIYTASGAEGVGDGDGTVVASFYRVKPGSIGVEGKPNTGVEWSFIRLLLRRGHKSIKSGTNLADLAMEERPMPTTAAPSLANIAGIQSSLDGAPPAPTGAYLYRILATDVGKVKVWAQTKDPTTNQFVPVPLGQRRLTACIVSIEVDCVEPFLGRRTVFRKFEADAHVGVDLR